MPLQYHQLPKQIVTPYKPSDDHHDQSSSLTRASSDVSDRAPLLKKVTCDTEHQACVSQLCD